MKPEEINNTGVVRQIKGSRIPFMDKLKAIEAVHRIINNNEACFEYKDTIHLCFFCVWAKTKEGTAYWRNLENSIMG
jgi:hypothetical protein